MLGKTLLVVNPRAGTGSVKNALLDIILKLSDGGASVTVFPTKPGDGLERFLRDGGETFDTVVAVGGDGTLNMTVNAMLSSGVGAKANLGYIPMGSTNDFSISMKIPSNYRKSTDALVSGFPVPIDVGSFNGRNFCYIAACGLFVDSSYTTSQSLKNILGHAAYLLNALPTLTDLRAVRLRVDVNGQTYEGDYALCALTNSTSAAGIVKFDGRRINFNDGLFELILIRMPTDLAEASRIAGKLLSGNLSDEKIVVAHTDAVRVVSESPVGWSVDGENGGRLTEAFMTVKKSALRILK
ncbi:MAG: YegS/Rv2252/BmrU family lipid kinase [Clostridia bacterium]|nr:YegS/Rv2252/BmrU family lipid kinase [Clostridia bacterium]